jgi:WXG100 family type VII secretion target
MASDLKFDIDAFSKAISKYENIAEQLKSIEKDVKQTISDLKTQYWKSEAGEAFDKLYNEEWVAHVEQYVTVLGELNKLLKKARTDYQAVEDEIKRINY